MGKKYLLYIHDPRFDKELKKSQLVNDLLAGHYGTELTNMRLEASVAAERAMTESAEALFKPEIKLCPIHGVPLTDYGKCLQKGCKYS